jgi:hypothetical protein
MSILRCVDDAQGWLSQNTLRSSTDVLAPTRIS